MTVPAVAAPIELPPQTEAPEEASGEAGAFAAMLSKEATASNEEELDTPAEDEELARVEVDALPGAAEEDTELLSQLLSAVLGDTATPLPSGPAGPPSAGATAELVAPTLPGTAAQPSLPAAAAATEASPESARTELANQPATAPLPAAATESEVPIAQPAAARPEEAARLAPAAPLEASRPSEASSTPQSQANVFEAAADGTSGGRSGLRQGGAEDPGREANAEAGRAAQATPAADEIRQPTGPDRFAEILSTPQASGETAEAQPATSQVAPPPISVPLAPGLAPVVPITATLPVGAPAEVVPVHVEWLAARGGGSARLQLDPPNLGEVEVSVTVRGSVVDVVIRAADPAAQAAVAQTRELLADGLANRDLRIDNFEVRGSGAESQSDSRSDQGPRDPATASSGQGNGDNTGTSDGEFGNESLLARPGTQRTAAAHPNSMIQTDPGNSGVDLHI